MLRSRRWFGAADLRAFSHRSRAIQMGYGPGMPEWGILPIPEKLLAGGVRNVVRLSDVRMSGTGYGACVLHSAR